MPMIYCGFVLSIFFYDLMETEWLFNSPKNSSYLSVCWDDEKRSRLGVVDKCAFCVSGARRGGASRHFKQDARAASKLSVIRPLNRRHLCTRVTSVERSSRLDNESKFNQNLMIALAKHPKQQHTNVSIISFTY